MKNKQMKKAINNMLTEFSSQLGFERKSKNNMGRNIAIAAAGVVGLSLIRRLIKNNMA